jgi:hypothetical protein
MLTGRTFKGAAIAAASLGGVITPMTDLIAAADAVKVEVTGNITPSCASSSTTLTLNAGDITKAGSAKYSFTVDCNAPFQYSMRSENGALRLVNAPANAAASHIEAPYDVHIRIPLTLGGAIDDTCNSAAIKQGAVACKFTDSGQKIAVNQTAETQISWNASQAQLMAGQYRDRLTITVTVKL